MHRTKVNVVEEALDANNTIAKANRADFDRAGVTVINFMSAPGAGKTTLLEGVVSSLPGVRVGVLEGDVQGSMDADRLASLHVPVTQLNTDPSFGGECHLDANMVRSALPALPLDSIDLLVIENVGNLVCPAEFRVGEDLRVMVSSVTEGEDKPLKYPLMFRTCDLVIVNKVDLLPHLDYDLERFLYNLDAVHPDVDRMLVSARTGEGMDAWRDVADRGRDAGGGACVKTVVQSGAPARVDELLARRSEANRRFFEDEAERLARLCHLTAERFARGGRLIAFGRSPSARSDARHVAVEFVHPVIVGKRALPAIGLAGEGGDLAHQVDLIARPDDIAIAFGADDGDGEAARALAIAGARGCLTLAFCPAGAEWEFIPPSADPAVRQELVETLYHLLWELVHVFFDHRGLLAGRDARPVHDAGASSFLYPFLDEREHQLEPVVEDVRRSILMKADEVQALRIQTLTDNRAALVDAAAALRASFDERRQAARVWQRRVGHRRDGHGCGLPIAGRCRPRVPGHRPDRGRGHPHGDRQRHRSRRHLLATGDRLWVARRRAGRDLDVGQLAQSDRRAGRGRRRGLVTIALVGYDGGQVASDSLADHVMVTRSEHIPRIQEAQASAYHVLRDLVELVRT